MFTGDRAAVARVDSAPLAFYERACDDDRGHLEPVGPFRSAVRAGSFARHPLRHQIP